MHTLSLSQKQAFTKTWQALLYLFIVLFIQKHKKYHCLKQIHSNSREIEDLF